MVPFLVILVLGALMIVFLQWSAAQVDYIARERDRSTAKAVLRQSIDSVGQGVEVGASSPWLRAQLSGQALDAKGLDGFVQRHFFHYAGLDEVYLLRADGTCAYAMRGAKQAMEQTYIAIEDHSDPLVGRVRRLHIGEKVKGASSKSVVPVLADIQIVRGRPAIITVNPVLTGEEAIGKELGQVPVVVGVAFLDGTFFARVSRDFGLSGLHYEAFTPRESEATFEPLRARGGRVIGYLVWDSFAAGAKVFSVLAPVLLVVVLLSAGIAYVLALRLARRTRDLEISRSEAQYQALHDPLTGLANRVLFEARLDKALARCRNHEGNLALLCLDLDRFKDINDTLGHPAGDQLIRQVADRLRAEVRCDDVVARMGGDEFSIIIADPPGREAVEGICARIVEELARPFKLSGTRAYIGASMGVVFAPQGCGERTELSRRVDIALYAAKERGRGRFVVFTPEMDADIRAREEAVRALRLAIHEDPEQFQVHYQPVFCARSGAMTAVEALVRWQHPQKGLLGPSAFVPEAEGAGLIEALGLLVLRRALADAGAWPMLRINVNVSPSQMQDPGFARAVGDLLEAAGLAPERLELELTETALMDSSQDVAMTISRLRQAGVGCALDDFGTGYSSLSHIRDMAVDRIKIDRSFVQLIAGGQGSGLVEAIVQLARARGMQVTAEGVETESQLRFLRALGCHELQGFLLSEPLSAQALSNRLAQGQLSAFGVLDRVEGVDWML